MHTYIHTYMTTVRQGVGPEQPQQEVHLNNCWARRERRLPHRGDRCWLELGYIRMYVCVCMYLQYALYIYFLYIFMYVLYVLTWLKFVSIYVCMYLCRHLCTYVCIYVCIKNYVPKTLSVYVWMLWIYVLYNVL